MGYKRELLHAIYSVHSHWVERFPLACCKGCAVCCTQSVTMTSLEGEEILNFAKRKDMEKWLHEKLAGAKPGKSKAAISANQFAEACLKHQEVDSDTLGSWDFTPCVFLEDSSCSIYEVRPFGCRSFISFVQCATDRAAEIAPMHLTVNTVFTQIIEHVSSDGGYWSSMADILHSLTGRNTQGEIHRVPARPVPGFLLVDQEVQVVHALLQQISGQFSGKGTFADLIDNFMPI